MRPLCICRANHTDVLLWRIGGQSSSGSRRGIERGRTYLKLVPVFLQLNALAETRMRGWRETYLEADPADVAKRSGNGRHLDCCSMGVKLSRAVRRGQSRDAIERGSTAAVLTQVPGREVGGSNPTNHEAPVSKGTYLGLPAHRSFTLQPADLDPFQSVPPPGPSILCSREAQYRERPPGFRCGNARPECRDKMWHR